MSWYHGTFERTHFNKFDQNAQNIKKLILVSTGPKYNGSKSKRREQIFYLSAFLNLMKMRMQTKNTQI